MKAFEVSITRLATFRCQVYASFVLRPDALLELVESIPLTPRLRSAIWVCLSALFRRRFPSVYDALDNGVMDTAKLQATLTEHEPEDAERIAGYAIYPIDTTIIPHPDADTLPDRGYHHSTTQDRWVPSHLFSWLGRLVAPGQSWIAPLSVERVETRQTANEVGASQVETLAKGAGPDAQKVVVGDTHYSWAPFLSALVGLKHVFALVRLDPDRILHRAAAEEGTSQPTRLSLKNMPPPERHLETTLQTPFRKQARNVRISSWSHLFFAKLPGLVGSVVRLELLKADGTPLYKWPMWLFWTGPADTPLEDLARIYLARSAIEHFFRFLKQNLGLLAYHGTNLVAEKNWVWAVTLAYWHLLLARHLVTPQHHPWDPSARRDPQRPLTPGQVLNAWPIFYAALEVLAKAPAPAGKAPGRAKGFHPDPRPRHPAISKSEAKRQQQQERAATVA